MGILSAEIVSFLKLCKVMYALMHINAGEVDPDSWKAWVSDHLDSQQVAYVLECWAPKSHWALHLHKHFRDHKVLLSTFLHERKHKTCKRIASDMYNAVGWEKGLMEALTVQALYDLQVPRTGVDLLAHKRPSKKLLAALEGFFVHWGKQRDFDIQRCHSQQ